jgi:hypothetical protein
MYNLVHESKNIFIVKGKNNILRGEYLEGREIDKMLKRDA